MGDHGAFLSDHCDDTDPDANSGDAIVDSLGVLLAVKWPIHYDGRYDDEIHSLIDFSWYLLQFLSGDAMDESQKPRSASYFYSKKGRLIYEVVRDGQIVPNPKGVERSEFRSQRARDFER